MQQYFIVHSFSSDRNARSDTGAFQLDSATLSKHMEAAVGG